MNWELDDNEQSARDVKVFVMIPETQAELDKYIEMSKDSKKSYLFADNPVQMYTGKLLAGNNIAENVHFFLMKK